MSLLSSNSKLKKDGIFNFTLPAYKSQSGLITCPMAKDCIANCYARQGCYQFSNVRNKHEKNLQATQNNDFSLNMIIDIIENKAEIVRIHDSGDFYSREYVAKWLTVIDAMPHVQFYAYTKSFHMFEGLILPDNFRLIQSCGGTLPVDESKPHSKVFDSHEALNKAGYVDASTSDLVALTSDKIGLVYHGTKKHNNNSFINK